MVVGPIKTDKAGYQFNYVLLLYLLLALPIGIAAQSRAPRIKEHPADTLVGRSEPATLRCVAEGKPKPIIQWFHDGVPLAVTDHPHRVLLEDGLVFLRVMRNKKENDEGIYWCVARNSVGEAFSKNASLTIAVLRDDFKSEPHDITVVSGEPAVLECSAPKGIPEPSLHWKKDNCSLDIEQGHRRISVKDGTLKILKTLPTDSGVYRCVATNLAGERESRPATINVLRKPNFIIKPRNKVALIGQSVEFHCQVSKDTDATVSWVRENRTLPLHTINQGTLRLDNIDSSYGGIYSCLAKSEAGTSVASALLNIYALPVITKVPSDQTVWQGESLLLPCEATGIPKPISFWKMEGSEELISPSPNYQGSLYLDKVHIQYAGRISCIVVNAAGSTEQTMTLKVMRREINIENEDKPKYNFGSMNQYELASAREHLQKFNPTLKKIEATNSTRRIRLIWNLNKTANWATYKGLDLFFLQGVKIWYKGTSLNKYEDSEISRTLKDDGSIKNGTIIKYVPLDIRQSSCYILENLLPFTKYEIFVIPFYKFLIGKPSNVMTWITEDGVPLAAPQHVTVENLNSSAARVYWKPPPMHTWNGELTGYVVTIHSCSLIREDLNIMTFGAKERSAVAGSLRQGTWFYAMVAALTKQGQGPYSKSVIICLEREQQMPRMYEEIWQVLLAILVLLIFGILIVAVEHLCKKGGGLFIDGVKNLLSSPSKKKLDSEVTKELPQNKSNSESSSQQKIETLPSNTNFSYGGHLTNTLRQENEYSIPQQPRYITGFPNRNANLINALNRRDPQEDRNKVPTEPYYSKIAYGDHSKGKDFCMKCNTSLGSYNNSLISGQFSNDGSCSTCYHSSTSTLTKDYSDMTGYGFQGTDSQADYDYPQWQRLVELRSQNSFGNMGHSNEVRSDGHRAINSWTVFPPPPPQYKW